MKLAILLIWTIQVHLPTTVGVGLLLNHFRHQLFGERQSGFCQLLDGNTGVCLDTRLCLARQKNVPMVWAVCEWPRTAMVPTRICCPKTEIEFRPAPEGMHQEEEDQSLIDSNQDKSGQLMDYDGQCGIVSQPPQRTSDKSLRIVMGTTVWPGQVPWMAQIYRHGRLCCGGSIINRRQVLSAAHCFDNSLDPVDYYILVGSVSLNSGAKHRISTIVVHHDYREPQIYHDLAVITVKEPFDFSQTVSPICLATKRMIGDNINGEVVSVAGFGDVEYLGQSSRVLQQVDLKAVDNRKCQEAFNHLPVAMLKFPYGVTRAFVCAGGDETGKDSCQGDSGGPLMLHSAGRVHLIGIVSFGFQCGVPGYPGVYTSVANYINWIRQQKY